MDSKNIRLNVNKWDPAEIIHYVQYSTEIPIEFYISDYDIPSGATARFYLKKPSGLEIYNECPVSGRKVTLKPTAQTFAESGRQNGQIQIVIGEDVLVSFILKFEIEKNLITDSAIESSNEFGVLDDLIKQAQAVIKETETATSAAEEATQAANTAATNANQKATAANTAAGKANTAATNADNKAAAANTAAGTANTAATAANAAAERANLAADGAYAATRTAQEASSQATNAANTAGDATDAANAAAQAANTAATNANQKATAANTAAGKANTAATNADNKAAAANTAAGTANTAATNANNKANAANTAAAAATAAAKNANTAAAGIPKMEDYVVDYYTQGVWTIQKWNSGKMEMWGDRESSFPAGTNMGNGQYRSILQLNFSSYGMKKLISGQCPYQNSGMIPQVTRNGTNLSLAEIIIIRPEAIAAFSATLPLYLIGTWK